ncbi:hypothetical protein BCR33DRAFT_849694 [Rhizoclosmatium globosum]|uniref:Uncharacterized protein n=1 Tax=Rhizoclosmatium globosum TaxID=329046 RepID=A0A1Y2CGA3_9FUNG|nr:hypothetical protein BCR33DRAFT_849694 [Rhizoclosmatium globosum]|eukprot:ORY46083.1 hypothetical protein BCR33DRAFT_849694 [Rhizoclosmatium globosum]
MVKATSSFLLSFFLVSTTTFAQVQIIGDTCTELGTPCLNSWLTCATRAGTFEGSGPGVCTDVRAYRNKGETCDVAKESAPCLAGLTCTPSSSKNGTGTVAVCEGTATEKVDKVWRLPGDTCDGTSKLCLPGQTCSEGVCKVKFHNVEPEGMCMKEDSLYYGICEPGVAICFHNKCYAQFEKGPVVQDKSLGAVDFTKAGGKCLENQSIPFGGMSGTQYLCVDSQAAVTTTGSSKSGSVVGAALGAITFSYMLLI